MLAGDLDRRKTLTRLPGRNVQHPTTARGPGKGRLTICIFRAKDLFAKLDRRRERPVDFSWRENVATGTVKWYNPTKGYGFIQPQGGGPDVFVHVSAVERAGLQGLNEGQNVDYELVTGRNGKASAENLKTK
jgi:CspA family cold shock protein